jgi:hypothetical protein
MNKFYKELRNCRICKKNFVLQKEEARQGKASYFYCLTCFEKYKDKKD